MTSRASLLVFDLTTFVPEQNENRHSVIRKILAPMFFQHSACDAYVQDFRNNVSHRLWHQLCFAILKCVHACMQEIPLPSCIRSVFHVELMGLIPFCLHPVQFVSRSFKSAVTSQHQAYGGGCPLRVAANAITSPILTLTVRTRAKVVLT